MVKLNSFHQTLERSEGSADVQELNTAVVQQLIALVGLQGTHGHTGQLFAWICREKNTLKMQDTCYDWNIKVSENIFFLITKVIITFVTVHNIYCFIFRIDMFM